MEKEKEETISKVKKILEKEKKKTEKEKEKIFGEGKGGKYLEKENI